MLNEVHKQRDVREATNTVEDVQFEQDTAFVAKEYCGTTDPDVLANLRNNILFKAIMLLARELRSVAIQVDYLEKDVQDICARLEISLEEPNA